MINRLVRLHPDVQKALEQGAPVVALESTIITHGMPYPENVRMAREVEEILRGYGVTPATIALLDGEIRIGLNDEEIEQLATSRDPVKVSRRDLAAVCAQKKSGGTTVAATMLLAEMAGIRIFVTGGLGGVHRGFGETMDVSADLEELARTSVAIVCAGAKAILDLPRTMEYLETKGVPVIGYQTDELPAFYTRTSGIPVPIRVDTPEEAAAVLAAQDALALTGGTLIANPIPAEEGLEATYIDALIVEAIEDAKQEGIRGKATTPYLLDALLRKTEGKSLDANIALVKNNAHVGAQIAAAYHRMRFEAAVHGKKGES